MAPQKITRPSQPSFSSLFASQTSRAPRSRLRGCASHPRQPKSDSLFGGAGRNNRPLTKAPLGGRGPSLASLVALGCSLALVRCLIFLAKYAIGPKGNFFEVLFKSNQIYFFPLRLLLKKNLVKTGPNKKNGNKQILRAIIRAGPAEVLIGWLIGDAPLNIELHT